MTTGFIPGIHNYCDRWWTVLLHQPLLCVWKTDNLSPEEKDIQNKAFWDGLSNQFAETISMLHKMAAERGFDINSISEKEKDKYEKRESLLRKKTEASPLSKAAKTYSTEGRKWLEKTGRFREMGEEYIRNFELGIRSEAMVRSDAAMIKDCVEVIQWYLHFIYVKFSRAISGKVEDDGWEVANGFQRDWDGSAKIALISVQRSMEAWMKLYERMPEEQENILLLLALLQRIQKLGEAEFPGAAAFKRPGFDEGG